MRWPTASLKTPTLPARMSGEARRAARSRRIELFNFFSYEGWRTIEPRSVFNTLPTEARAERRLFSLIESSMASPRIIYDPYTTRTVGNNGHPSILFPETSSLLTASTPLPSGS